MNKKVLSILAMFWHGSSDHVGSLGRLELNLLCVNQVLDLIFQAQTIICSMPQAVRVINAAGAGVILR